MERRYLWAMPVVVLMCLSRPTGVPFAAMVGLLFLYRVLAAVADPGPKPRRTARNLHRACTAAASCWSLAGLTAVSGVGCAAVAGHRLGRDRRHRAPTPRPKPSGAAHDLVPFKPWFDTGILLFGPVLGVLAPFVFVAAFALLMMSRPVVRPGHGAEAVVRLLHGLSAGVPAPPDQHLPDAAAAVPARPQRRPVSRSRAYRGTVVIMFVLLQIVWIVWLWAWAQLPGGGDYPP